VNGIYRHEAIEHHARGAEDGELLRFDPRWLKIAVRTIAGAAIAGVLFMFAFSVDEYATGPAVIRIDGRRIVTSSASGPVESLEVHAGQRVEVGDVLLRMTSKDETAELERATTEHDLQLVHYLVDPHDQAGRATLASLRARREAARNALEAKTVRAVVAGTVSDMRVRPGQVVTAGEVLCAVVPGEAHEVSIVALVPADYRPMLKSGLEMRFELDGFRYEYAEVSVEEVSSEAVGPGEVARLLGNEHDGAVKLDPGGKVFVTGKLPATTFTSEGQPYAYFDGLTGNAEVRVRRESIVVTLIPALRQVFR
jgi:membrane fusion protein (multidrug efflux system)